MILSFAPRPGLSAAFLAALLACSAGALAAYALAAVLTTRRAATAPARAAGALMAAWLLHGLAIAVDISGFGNAEPGARFGFAPAVSATLWLVMSVYIWESRRLPLPAARRPLALLGAAAVLLALVFPGEPLPRALARWAPLHWVLGMASYGLFGAAVLHAAMMRRAERLMRHPGRPTASDEPVPPVGVPLLQLERLTLRFVAAGFVVLTAAIALGAGVAHPWHWDHKTVFSLLAWLVFAALLIGRRAFGWRGLQVTRWLYAGAGLLLLAYVGSRFVLEVLLHRVPGA